MVRQWRNALDRYTLEIPAGGLNGAEEDVYKRQMDNKRTLMEFLN